MDEHIKEIKVCGFLNLFIRPSVPFVFCFDFVLCPIEREHKNDRQIRKYFITPENKQ